MFDSVSIPENPKWLKWATIAIIAIVFISGAVWLWRITKMPLSSFDGSLPPLAAHQEELRDRLAVHVHELSTKIGERNLSRPAALSQARSYIESQLEGFGYTPHRQCYAVAENQVCNIEAEIRGVAALQDMLVIGAHYDSAANTPGADDNASGVAALLELTRLLRETKRSTTLRFVFFVNEEPPYFQSRNMGSVVYSRQLREQNTHVIGMLSLETLGFYSDTPSSQKYPFPLGLFYPSRGNFVAFVSDHQSDKLLYKAIVSFRESTQFPSEGIAAPPSWEGVGWSDHWAFWQVGYPAIMITDTAVFRYPFYHLSNDTESKINFERLARVVGGLQNVAESLAKPIPTH